MEYTGQWAYAECKDAEYWYGPVDTKEEAIMKARELTYGEGDIVIGKAVYPTAEQLVTFFQIEDIDEILIRAEEIMEDSAWYVSPYGETLDVVEGAEEALRELMAAWVKKYVRCKVFTAFKVTDIEGVK